MKSNLNVFNKFFLSLALVVSTQSLMAQTKKPKYVAAPLNMKIGDLLTKNPKITVAKDANATEISDDSIDFEFKNIKPDEDNANSLFIDIVNPVKISEAPDHPESIINMKLPANTSFTVDECDLLGDENASASCTMTPVTDKKLKQFKDLQFSDLKPTIYVGPSVQALTIEEFQKQYPNSLNFFFDANIHADVEL